MLDIDFELELQGEVEGGILRLKPRLPNGQEKEIENLLKALGLAELHVPVRGSVLNPMHLLNRLPGLRPQQSWRVPVLDPGLAGMSLSELEALVVEANLPWKDKGKDAEVSCYMIEYREPGKNDLRARTWVRQRDGLVLQQQASFASREFVIQRTPPKELP
jgi:hypothetical protein